MKLKFNLYVELIFGFFSLLGLAVRYWAVPEFSFGLHVVFAIAQFLAFNLIWIFYYWLDYKLNQVMPFEKGVARRVVVQLLLGWGVMKVFLIPMGLVMLFAAIPSITNYINKLNIVFIGLTAFFGSTVMNAGFIAMHFLKRWKENAVRAANLEKEKAQVQFNTLKNQVNPHFLFNSLASLDTLIQENPALARQFVHQLSKVYRYVLQSQEKGLVPLETEVDFVNNYISLLKARFDGSLRVHFQIPDELYERQIVPVTLQVLIENAIKHNVISKEHPLQIEVAANENQLVVTNTICKKKKIKIETSNGYGLNNLKALYHYLSKEDVQVEESADRFTVRVPWAVEGAS
ncbi:sensor histidine kinase [Telluribacter sp.]|jgi:sensor histidine kinase YesM|uniref:sensor histidine kinase n=1 Tax=Telluribacter sp. TaxID=1978767 RepID=UPI002E158C34|nr:histidine kinase [Telluribacter sp.]